MGRWVLRVMSWVVISLAVVAGVGLGAGYLYESAASAREAQIHQPPGRLVRVGGRNVHLLCKGEGDGPVVVIEPGAAEPSMLWWSVQDEITAFARVCTYDRAGYQWSQAVSMPRSIEDRADELRTVLTGGGVPGPYVFVAHSYGGAIVRLFARDYPADTAGLVLVDTPDEVIMFGPAYADVVARGRWVLTVAAFAMRCGIVRAWTALSDDGGREDDAKISPAARAMWPMAFRPEALDAARDDMASIANAPAALRVGAGFGRLGDLPLVVIAHGLPFPEPFDTLEPGFRDSQRRLAALSSKGELVIAARSNHNIHMDQPDLVVAAVRRVSEAARH